MEEGWTWKKENLNKNAAGIIKALPNNSQVTLAMSVAGSDDLQHKTAMTGASIWTCLSILWLALYPDWQGEKSVFIVGIMQYNIVKYSTLPVYYTDASAQH